jgi:5-methylcytosine-specific restriction endonuclease McrA
MFFIKIKPITNKRLKQLQRDAGDSKYRQWRKDVLKRDKNVCQMPGCKSKNRLEVHHIKRFADAKHLKIETYNGITLCRKCHKSIHNREQAYEILFMKIAESNEAKNSKNTD